VRADAVGYQITRPEGKARPGEAGRIRWSYVKPWERAIEIPAGKAGNLIRIIMSASIARVLKRACDLGKPKDGNALVFPFCGELRDDLPSKGHAFRHTWRTIAAALKIDTTLVRVMQGLANDEVSEDYVNEQELAGDSALREAQRRMSVKIISLSGADPTKGH
jgi:integrase